jgi:hypothetical protein
MAGVCVFVLLDLVVFFSGFFQLPLWQFETGYRKPPIEVICNSVFLSSRGSSSLSTSPPFLMSIQTPRQLGQGSFVPFQPSRFEQGSHLGASRKSGKAHDALPMQA